MISLISSIGEFILDYLAHKLGGLGFLWWVIDEFYTYSAYREA